MNVEMQPWQKEVMKSIRWEPGIREAMMIGSAMEARAALLKIGEQAIYHDDGRIKTACNDAIKAFEAVVAETVITKSDA
jgi:hypothetical protein